MTRQLAKQCGRMGVGACFSRRALSPELLRGRLTRQRSPLGGGERCFLLERSSP